MGPASIWHDPAQARPFRRGPRRLPRIGGALPLRQRPEWICDHRERLRTARGRKGTARAARDTRWRGRNVVESSRNRPAPQHQGPGWPLDCPGRPPGAAARLRARSCDGHRRRVRLRARGRAVNVEAERSPTATSERRQITVLFADIANSTAIAEHMDPEDWTSIVGEAFGLMNRTIERYDGTVARLMGDGVLAFFGAPVAHEDDPERAVRCGLEMVRAIDDLGTKHRAQTGADLRVRVGINTGPVVVGVVGTEKAHEYTAMGDAVNIAARMQAHAAPGSVLITAATHRFLAPLLDARDVGLLELKGKTDAVQAFAVTGLKSGAVSARGLGGIRAPMIGRDDELARLRELFAVARAGQGRVASVLGEPGIGKTRLLGELRSEVARTDPKTRWLEGRCLSYGQALPYHLVVDLVRSPLDPARAGHASAALGARPRDRQTLRRVAPHGAPCDLDRCTGGARARGSALG
ncbi:MAG: hypothetical protein E6I64_05370 [Chloroflexi bacterium]|nr:MAG: hypothetical protein E6I64_05370 [Chloroflexota bacterium]